jgi:uncharacterized protein (TIGR02117 family)
MFIFFCLNFLCLLDPGALAQNKTAENKHVIFVSSIGWHTGIVVPAYSLPDSIWRDASDYPDMDYLEIGWGDADFYTHDGFNLWYTFKAVFWPTSSVLHINPIPQEVTSYYTDTRVVRIELEEEQFHRLSHYLFEALALDESGKIIPYQEGIYPKSYFYEGSSRYYFPNNSNVWVARAIKRAGLPIWPVWHQTTGSVLNKMEKFGILVVEKE